MANTWRMFGLTYVHYSNIAAKMLRGSLKPAEKEAAEVRNRSVVRFTHWENGKPAAKTVAKKST